MKKKLNKRWQILSKIINENDFKVGAEIGVWKGKTTEFILEFNKRVEKYICVDSWSFYEEYVDSLNPEGAFLNKNEMDDVYKEFIQAITPYWEKVEIYKMDSEEAAQYIEDKSLDWCFIDANHAYEYVKRDIELWWPKVRPGGLLCGHDFSNRPIYQGVVKAVIEKFGRESISVNKDAFWKRWKENELQEKQPGNNEAVTPSGEAQ